MLVTCHDDDDDIYIYIYMCVCVSVCVFINKFYPKNLFMKH